MIKSILILFFVTLCSNQSWLVTGHNCGESSSHKTNECIFECVKMLYDKEYCTSCDIGAKETQMNLKPNQTLTSLMQHSNYVHYNDVTQSINTGNCSGCTVNKTDESFFERFKQSEMLLRFINCTTDFTAANTTSTNCEDDEINGLYENLTQRLEKFEWCNSLASDIRNQNFKHKMLEVVSKRSNTSDDTGNGTESSVTEQSKSSAEASMITVIPSHENMKEDVTKPSFAANETETTTKSTVTVVTEDSSTAKSPESTTKSAKTKPTKKKKFVEEHHYMGSVTIIVIIVSVILVILMVSALVLRVFVARRQNIQPRSSSTTYVFDSTHY